MIRAKAVTAAICISSAPSVKPRLKYSAELGVEPDRKAIPTVMAFLKNAASRYIPPKARVFLVV